MSELSVNHFRPRRPGPEQALEDVIISGLPGFLAWGEYWWLGGSLPLGAGSPDLLAVRYERALENAGVLGREAIEVLAYLRVVGQARRDTVASRLQFSMAAADAGIVALGEAGALDATAGELLALTPQWREVLPEIIAIEVKVSDWRRALAQATRNLVFAHRSFVALPADLADRVRTRYEFAQVGVGIIAVGDNSDITVSRRSRRSGPRAWRYYYELASHIATTTGIGDALCCSD